MSAGWSKALQHARQNEINSNELHDRFRNATDSLKEVEKQNQYLRNVIQDKEKIFTSTIYKEKEFKERMTSLVESMREFENLVTYQQTIIANKIQHSESRCLYLHCIQYWGYLFIFVKTRLLDDN